MGWSAPQVDVIDDDLGLSGARALSDLAPNLTA
jgi:hypothetical protein